MPTTAYTALGWNVFTVPSKVTSIEVALNGGGSGDRPGGRVTGKLAVTAGQKLYCHVGGAGRLHSGVTGGANAAGSGAAGGNGHSNNGGNGGGGYSAIRVGSATGTLRAVAGGAGGDSGDGGQGGPGGGTTGGQGLPGAAIPPTPVFDDINVVTNPSLAGGSATGWNTNSARLYPLDMDVTAQMSGPNSMVSTRTDLDPSPAASSVYLGLPGLPCTAGVPVTASVDTKCQQASRKINVFFSWLDASGAVLGYSDNVTDAIANTGLALTKLRPTATATPPTGAVKCLMNVTVSTLAGNAVTGEKVWYDNLRLSPDTKTVSTTSRTNMAMNPGCEVGTESWGSSQPSVYVFGTDTVAPIAGTTSATITRDPGSPTTVVAQILGGSGPNSVDFGRYPVVAGQTYTGAMSVKTDVTGARISTRLYWYDIGGSSITSAETQVVTGAVANQVYRVSETGVAPAGAFKGLFSVLVRTPSGVVVGGEVVWFDLLTLEQGATDGSYFDGSSIPSGNLWYRWTGTPHASSSEQKLINTRSTADLISYYDGSTADTALFDYRWTGTVNASTSERWSVFPPAAQAAVGNATGGTQSQGGNGGTSGAGTQFDGRNATDITLAVGGAGGVAGAGVACHGGGGGGGGYYSGGGGQASSVGFAPGGGGAGGSSWMGGLTGAANTQGGGGVSNGSVSITWVTPPPANIPPNVPSALKINNVEEESGLLTKATTSVKVTATLLDPNKKNVRMVVRYSANSSFTPYSTVISGYVAWAKSGKTATVTLTGLSQNTRYYVRVYAQDASGMYSTGYNGTDFWTNKAPLAPTELGINTQGAGMSLPSVSSATFDWDHNDEDIADYQSGFQIQYRKSATSATVAGAWTVVTQYIGQNLAPVVPGPPSSSHNEWVFDPGTFKGNTFYEWQVRTRDLQNLWGAWSTLFSFHATATSSPPILISPRIGLVVDVHEPSLFTWRFVDPDTGDRQLRADFRYRAVGRTVDVTGGAAPTAPDWIVLPGSITVPGGSPSWTIPADTFAAEYTYEWQVRTYDTSGGPSSEWSTSNRFYAIDTPGSENGPLPLGAATKPQGSLGCGNYRVFIYEQGGQRRLGELEPMSRMTFTRVRDDISSCTVFSNGYSADCGALLAGTRSWMHELVVFRDGVRVWEGPITRIGYSQTEVEIEAKDVMAYVLRRVLRVGYNDAYRLIKKGVGGEPDQYLGLLSVVKRAAMLITQALAPYDPNVLPYLTAIEYPDDARESRVIVDWSRSAWEEVDDLAATAGLDYTTVGRRILLWDTHRPIGRLPEFRDGDFSDSPIVTEYGMQLATLFAVTNGSGVVGVAEVEAGIVPYGPIEHLASSYSDSAAASAEVQTPAALAAAQQSMEEQAARNITGRWPSPLIVRIPDNSTVSPKANVGFQQLIPGVWLPLRSVNTPRQVLQWQKLDSVGVEVDDKGEKVHVVLSPAPNGGNDPDSDLAEPEG